MWRRVKQNKDVVPSDARSAEQPGGLFSEEANRRETEKQSSCRPKADRRLGTSEASTLPFYKTNPMSPRSLTNGRADAHRPVGPHPPEAAPRAKSTPRGGIGRARMEFLAKQSQSRLNRQKIRPPAHLAASFCGRKSGRVVRFDMLPD
jgi:hypothetical protein